MKKLTLFIIPILLIFTSCKKEKELHINPPAWIHGSWCYEDANTLFSFSYEHFYSGQCSINSQTLDFGSVYSVDKQTSTSNTYYLMLRSHNDVLSEFTFTKTSDTTMLVKSNSSLRTYVKH